MTNMPLAHAAQQAISAYQSVDATTTPAATGADFASLLTRTLGGAVQTGQDAEARATQAVAGTGTGGLTQVVTAVSRAELALQTTIAVRDRVIQAYQDIIKMNI